MSSPSPYRPPEARLAGEVDPALGELRLFVSGGLMRQERRERYYLSRWTAVLRGERRLAGWNWAAFFVPELWCIYRRMYLLGLVVWIAGWLLPPLLALLGLRVGCGLGANYVYLQRARTRVARIRLAQLDPAQHSARVAASGGTNPAALLVAALLWLLAFPFLGAWI